MPAFLEEKVSAALKVLAWENDEPCPVVAAVSGGADSTAMLCALARLVRTHFVRPQLAVPQIFCVHVDHALRPDEETSGDAAFVQNLCAEKGIPCAVAHIRRGEIEERAKQKKSGIEDAARFFRRAALTREAEKHGAKWLLLAHTQDDLLETVLMRMLRGAGSAGLGGMPQTAMPQKSGHLKILRPLLGLTRQDVLAYLKDSGQLWREDPSNADWKFLRNSVRHCLVPLLDEGFPFWRKGLLATAETARLGADFLADEVARHVKAADGGFVIEGVCEMPTLLQEEAVFAAYDKVFTEHARRNRTLRRAALRAWLLDPHSKALDLPGNIRVLRNGDSLVVRQGC